MENLTHNGLIRSRINQNLLKVKYESRDIKNLLKLGLQSSNHYTVKCKNNPSRDILNEISLRSRHISRKELLRTCILLGTSRNISAQQNLINIISLRLGTINEKDYKYIADMIYYREAEVVSKVNSFLSHYLEGFKDLHNKFYNQYYEF